MMSIQVETSPVLKTGTPTELFAIAGKPWPSFELSSDDKKLLAVVPEVAADEQPMTVVVDWRATAAK